MAVLHAAPPPVPPPPPACEASACEAVLTADELLALADRLTMARRFAEAEPLLRALAQVPRLAVERAFLLGYTAAETGRLDDAVRLFRYVLVRRPDLTRARLELARALALLGRNQAADYHLRLAGAAGALPADLARTVFAMRALLRDRDRIGIDLAIGIAPDSNINNATAERSLDVDILGEKLPLQLADDARQTSGVGITATLAGRLRQPVGEAVNLVAEAFTRSTLYPSAPANFDDHALTLAAGPEWRSADGRTRLSALGQLSGRWFGGRQLQRAGGIRLVAERTADRATRVTGTLDLRLLGSAFGEAFAGRQLLARVTVDRVLRQSLILTAGATVRREALNDPGFANTEAGVLLGLGGELPHGINLGISLDLSRGWADAAIPLLSGAPRTDWRYGARFTLASRTLRIIGFSPVVAYSLAGSRSSIPLYTFARHRLEMTMARVF